MVRGTAPPPDEGGSGTAVEQVAPLEPWSRTAIPSFPDFRPLAATDQPRVRSALARSPGEISDLTFACLWVWRRTLPVSIAALDGGLALVIDSGRWPVFAAPPLGAGDPAASAERLLRWMRKTYGPAAALRLVPAPLARELERRGWRVEAHRAAADYVYRTADLIGLSGRRYAAKRNWIRRCLAAHDCRYERMAGPVTAECAAFFEEWCRMRADDAGFELRAEADAVRETFAAWDALGLRGGAVRVDGAIRAFAVGEPLSTSMAVQHFEKADPAVPGLYQVVNRWFLREEFAGFEWINREEDLGDPGLRRAKLSYHPARMVEKYVVDGGDAG